MATSKTKKPSGAKPSVTKPSAGKASGSVAEVLSPLVARVGGERKGASPGKGAVGVVGSGARRSVLRGEVGDQNPDFGTSSRGTAIRKAKDGEYSPTKRAAKNRSDFLETSAPKSKTPPPWEAECDTVPTSMVKQLHEATQLPRKPLTKKQSALVTELLSDDNEVIPQQRKGKPHSKLPAKRVLPPEAPAEKPKRACADPAPGKNHMARYPLVPGKPYEGRVTSYFTLEMMDEMCDHISNGHALHHVCELPQYPDRKRFFKYVNENLEYSKRYNEALALRAELFADELTLAADMAVGETAEGVAARKLQVNTRQWIMSRLLPKKWGDRMVIAGDAENPLVTQLVLGGNDLVDKIKRGEK